jgi:predicted ATP-dependent endonuclease of OLD family
MYISKLKIKNFKCFDEVEINFDPNFNLIIGENNSGKSTIFEALRLWQLAIQQFFSKRTFKKGDGSNNISFYRKYQFEPLEISDLSFLRIDNFTNILNNKIIFKEQEDVENSIKNTFLIELSFSNIEGNSSTIPIVFRPNDKNILRCRIGLNEKLTFEDLKLYSHSLSKVMDLVNNDSFINRIRLAYIPPKFTLPNKEVLLSENNSFILEKLIKGESQNVIRNILHHWCEFSYQKNTKEKKAESIEKAKNRLINIIDPETLRQNFDNIKPFIENVLDFEVKQRRNIKSKFLKSIENGLKKIVNQNFNFISENNPIDDYVLQIKEIGNNTEISQLGSGTINVLNILSVLSYNDQTIENATKCNLLLLDEPDSHLQFNLQDKLFDFLNYQSNDENKQIFIITHNSSLISQFDNVLFITKNQKVINPIPLDEYLENHLKQIDENHYNVMKELSEAKKSKRRC